MESPVCLVWNSLEHDNIGWICEDRLCLQGNIIWKLQASVSEGTSACIHDDTNLHSHEVLHIDPANSFSWVAGNPSRMSRKMGQGLQINALITLSVSDKERLWELGIIFRGKVWKNNSIDANCYNLSIAAPLLLCYSLTLRYYDF